MNTIHCTMLTANPYMMQIVHFCQHVSSNSYKFMLWRKPVRIHVDFRKYENISIASNKEFVLVENKEKILRIELNLFKAFEDSYIYIHQSNKSNDCGHTQSQIRSFINGQRAHVDTLTTIYYHFKYLR